LLEDVGIAPDDAITGGARPAAEPSAPSPLTCANATEGGSPCPPAGPPKYGAARPTTARTALPLPATCARPCQDVFAPGRFSALLRAMPYAGRLRNRRPVLIAAFDRASDARIGSWRREEIERMDAKFCRAVLLAMISNLPRPGNRADFRCGPKRIFRRLCRSRRDATATGISCARSRERVCTRRPPRAGSWPRGMEATRDNSKRNI
jgi:hypothetical protein